jgi:glycosyltransferase involved in cell wall biosynthesis
MGEPIRVLELLVSTELGGGPAHVADLIARLPRGEFAGTVGAPAGGPFTERFRALGADFVPVTCDRLKPGVLGRVTELVRERRIHVIHSHGKGAGLYGRLAARRAGIAAVHTFHGLHYRAYPPGLREAYLALERWLAGMSHALIHVSESQRRRAAGLGLAPDDRSRVIVNGVDAHRIQTLARERPISRERLALEAGALVLGTVARFDRVKGLEVLLDAFARLAPRLPRAALLLVGYGPEAERLRERARRAPCGARVIFAGPVPEAARCLPAMDVYVSASRGEGLPLAMLEAMACGLPVVATRVPGHVDVIEDGVTGLLVPPDNADGLAAAAESLLASPERRLAMGQAGRRRVEERFSADRMAAEVAEVYRAAARGIPLGRAAVRGV